MTDPVTLVAALVGGAIGGVIGGVVASRLNKQASIELPPIDPKSIAVLVAQELETSLKELEDKIGSIGEKMASIEETVSSLYNIFAAYLGAARYGARTGRRRRVAAQAGQQSGGGEAGESKTQ